MTHFWEPSHKPPTRAPPRHDGREARRRTAAARADSGGHTPDSGHAKAGGRAPPTSSPQTPPRGPSPAEHTPAQPQTTRPSEQPKHTNTHRPARPRQRAPAGAGGGRPGASQPPRPRANGPQKRAKRPARQPRHPQMYRPPTKHPKKLARHRQ